MAGPARLTPTGLQPGSAESFSIFISGVPAAKTPFTGSERVPMIQGGFTVYAPPGSSGFGPPVRTILTANTNYYVTTTGSDANDGSLAHPWATLQHAMNVISDKLDTGGFLITINIGVGTFAGVGVKSVVGGGIIFWNGAGSSSTFISDGPNDGVFNFGESFSFNTEALAPHYFNQVTLNSANVGGGAAALIGNFVSGNQIAIGIVAGVLNCDVVFAGTALQAYFCNVPGILNLGFGGGTNPIKFNRTGGPTFLCEFEIGPSSNIFWISTSFSIIGNPTYSAAFILAFDHCAVTGNNQGVTGTFTGDLIGASTGTDIDLTFSSPNPVIVDPSSSYLGVMGVGTNAGPPTTAQLAVSNVEAVYKDTNQATATKAVVLYANDAGTVFPLTPVRTTFANLPASPHQGDMASITDGLAANCGDGSCTTFGTNVTGGTGALNLLIWYNGTHWTLMGK